MIAVLLSLMLSLASFHGAPSHSVGTFDVTGGGPVGNGCSSTTC